MRWQDGPRSSNVEDRRGQSFGGPLLIGGGGLGTIAVIIIAMLFGADPGEVLNQVQGQGAQQQIEPGAPRADDKDAAFASAVLARTEEVWGKEFEARGERYTPPTLVLYDNYTPTGCGGGQSAMGPFYCPNDQKLYVDLAFFRQLDERFGAPGDFARAYVIAHEVGHHVQTLMGVSDQVRRAQTMGGARANALQVKMELQADCLAGVWAERANQQSSILEPGDIDEAVTAAASVGDDTLQKASGRAVAPDSFTHGSSAQRTAWFKRGYEGGSLGACDTFNGGGA
ncbi:MAG: KPN_02809 family neutral zinc metallopeptidase [Caulobacteraceae bacterium]